MTPEGFDGLIRLWAAAPSRRAFLLQVGGIVVFASLDGLGIRLPGWMVPPPRRHPQCYKQREGVECGECGICQGGQCYGYTDSVCVNPKRSWLTHGRCGRCDRGTGSCTRCAKGQQCCSDGCCDGACTKDGACCPPAKQCGEGCCRDCEVCRDGTCQYQGGQTECPPNYTLIVTPPYTDGCCVCLQGLCGDQCCAEDEVCLNGKCCKRCGMDRAICCDDLICCRERCQHPSEPCCPCREDISPEEGKKIEELARKTMQDVKDHKIKYGQNREALGQMDCTLFVAVALQNHLGSGEWDTGSRTLDGNCLFRRLKPGEEPRAGDVLAQPRSSGLPGSQHAGISLGTRHAKGGQLGIAMGNSGVSDNSVWGVPPADKGWFEGWDELHVYRPQKPCKQS